MMSQLQKKLQIIVLINSKSPQIEDFSFYYLKIEENSYN